MSGHGGDAERDWNCTSRGDRTTMDPETQPLLKSSELTQRRTYTSDEIAEIAGFVVVEKTLGEAAKPTEHVQTEEVIQYLRTTKGRYLLAILLFLWILILWAAAIDKVVVWGLDDYIQYFTNWSWTLQLIYYTLDLLFYADGTRCAHYYLLMILWWPLFLTVTAVFILVMVVIGVDAKLFETAVKQYSVSAMLLGDRVVHVIPFVIVIIYAATCAAEIGEVMGAMCDNGKYGIRFIRYVVINYATPIAYVFLYMVTNNYQKVYHVSTNIAVACVAVAILYAVIYGIALAMMMPRTESVDLPRVVKYTVQSL